MLARMFDKWAAGRQRKEMEAYLSALRAMDGSELGLVVAAATDIKNALLDAGFDLGDPAILLATHPGVTYELSSRGVRLQKEGRFQEAAALMVWIHTLRAASRPELRGLGRQVWGELERGFPHIQTAMRDFFDLTGQHLDIAGATEFPMGLTPEPL